MLRRRHIKKDKPGQATLEFTVIIVILISAFLTFQRYIVQAIAGRWKSIGEAFHYGQIYSADHTMKCAFDQVHFQRWYNDNCFQELGCSKFCYSIKAQANAIPCTNCIQQCFTPYCDD